MVVGVGAMFATPHIKVRYQAWQDARQERAWASEFKRAQAAADALGQMPLPAGVENCPGVTNEILAKTHMVCWQGTAEIEPTTAELATNLRALGAENVSPRCLRRNGTGPAAIVNLMCEVTADIHGQTFFAHIGPDLEKVGDSYTSRGVAIRGDVGPAEDVWSVLGNRATPLPLTAVESRGEIACHAVRDEWVTSASVAHRSP